MFYILRHKCEKHVKIYEPYSKNIHGDYHPELMCSILAFSLQIFAASLIDKLYAVLMNIFDNILSWIIFGSVIGSLGYMFEPEHLRGKEPILFGIAGAIITGMITNIALNIPIAQFSLISFMVALCGSLFLVITSRALRNG